jgi:hypothetical protein
VREPPSFYGENDLEELLENFELEVMKIQRLLVLYISLKNKPAHWWGTHKEKIQDWYQCKRLLCIKFGTKHENTYMQKYDGRGRTT